MSASAFHAPVHPLRPIRSFATPVVILVTAVSATSAGLSAAHLLHAVGRILFEESPLWQAAYQWRDLYLILRVLFAFLYVPAGVAFVCWLFRARANAHAISPEVFHAYAAPYLVVGWFVPVVNLFVPKGIVDDIWASSRPGGLRPGTDLYRIRRSGLIWAWWLTWLLWTFTEGVTDYLVIAEAGVLEAVALAAHVATSIAAGLLAVRVVLTITGLQEAAYAVRARASEGPRPPYLGLCTLVVRDYDEAITFYTDVLGFDLLEDTHRGEDERWVTVRPKGARETALLLVRAATPEQEARVGDQAGGGTGMFLYTDDVARDHERMLSVGVTFEEDPRREPYGTAAVFRDLYGNRWNLLQPDAPA
jgi:catechol 2,3-dioxygenase-like lactoylglutathione lyase family enzyme